MNTNTPDKIIFSKQIKTDEHKNDATNDVCVRQYMPFELRRGFDISEDGAMFFVRELAVLKNNL